MTVVFGEDKKLTEFLLKILLSRDDLRVKTVMTQKEKRNLFGRSVRLDIVAEDAEGKIYNVEVQRADAMHYGEIAERVRFHKQEEEGGRTMCRIFEEYGEEIRAEARAERNAELVEKLLRQNKLSAEEIADTTDVPLEQVEQIAQKLAVTV